MTRWAGGFIGRLEASTGTIDQCYAVLTNLYGGSNNSGSFVGEAKEDIAITDCYVLSVYLSGGYFFDMSGEADIIRCYSIGDREVSTSFGNNNYLNEELLTATMYYPYPGTTGATTAEMISAATYSTWNINDPSSPWAIDEGVTLPYLKWQKNRPGKTDTYEVDSVTYSLNKGPQVRYYGPSVKLTNAPADTVVFTVYNANAERIYSPYGADVKFTGSTATVTIPLTIANQTVAIGFASESDIVNLIAPKQDDNFTVTYDPNGGNNQPTDDTPYEEGELVTVKLPGTMTKACHTFKGWTFDLTSQTIDFPYSGSSFTGGNTFTIDKDTILYAVWNNDTILNISPPAPLCEGTTITYADYATAPSGTLYFYSNDDCSTPVSGTTTQLTASNLTYYVKVVSGTCESACKPVTITVNMVATMEGYLIPHDTLICKGQSVHLPGRVTLKGTINNPQFKWFEDATTLDEITELTVTPQTTTSYWVSVKGTDHCEGPPNATGRAEVVITVIDCGIKLNLKLFLEGVTKEGPVMTNCLQHSCIDIMVTELPTENPYGIPGTCSKINEIGEMGEIVDWILVEIWGDFEGIDPVIKYNLLEKRALLLRPDGTVVDTTGQIPMLKLDTDEQVRVVVKHRNHLSVISSEFFDYDKDIDYNFSEDADRATKAFACAHPPMMEKHGTYCLWAGDLNMSHTVDNMDVSIFTNEIMLITVDKMYLLSDLNMDGMVSTVDQAIISANSSITLYSAVRFFQKRN
jgi:hypothetical protein